MIQIIGRRWLDKSAGNTYHSVKVYQDNQFIAREDFAYDYDDQYIQTAFALLQKARVYPTTIDKSKDYYNFRMEIRENRGNFLISYSDVGRKKDL